MVSELRTIGEGVFGFETQVALGLSMALPLRMTILRDRSGLVLVSPVELESSQREKLDELGEVHTLIAPNRLHTKFIEQAQIHYPQARLVAAAGVAKKCPNLRIDGLLGADRLSADLSAVPVDGAEKLCESVLFHEPSRSLVVTDLVFNVTEANFMTRCVLKGLSRAYGRVAQSRLLRTLTDDRKRAGRSVEQILELPFERLVVAHGDVVFVEAKEQLAEALKWMRGKL